MTRARLIASMLLAIAACGDDAPQRAPSTPASDALVPMSYEGGALEDRITIGPDPRDAAITEPTPILDLPLVIARPNAPLSTSTLEVLVTDPEGTPLADVAVTTGGPAVFTNAFGLATVSAVYGSDFSDVYAFRSQRTLALARVPIRPAETSAVELVLSDMKTYRVPDAAIAHQVPDEAAQAGADASLPLDLQARFPADAFEVPWGGVAKGPTLVGLSRLSEPDEAAALPGDMHALIDGERVPLSALLAFEVRVAQGATPLELVRDSTVSVAWPTHSAGTDYAAQQLFVFDAKEGAFVAGGQLDATSSPTGALATIDRLGTWLIGSPATAAHCARLDARFAGAPLPHASVLLSSQAAFGMARVELDASGSLCAPLSIAGPVRARAFTLVAGQRVLAAATAQLSTLVAACDEGCASTLLEGEALQVGCVRGTIDLAWLGFDVANVVVQDGAQTTAATVPANEPFCLDLRPGAQLELDTIYYRCGLDPVTVAASSAGASCGGDGCQDLGTITCCLGNDSCTPLGNDDDCDGLVDEGCTCGAVSCDVGAVSSNRCCDPSGACGEHSPITDECVGFQRISNSFECETIPVPGENGDTDMATGCCRSEGQCGVMWSAFGCVAATDVPRVWGAGTTLASRTCTPTP